jgi:hypothetical protein
MPLTIVEGWTAPIELTLLGAGEPVNITGGSVELRLFDKTQTEILESGALSIEIAASGLCKYTPENADFQEALSPYYVRVELTDAVGDVSYFPSNRADQWTVRGVSS